MQRSGRAGHVSSQSSPRANASPHITSPKKFMSLRSQFQAIVADAAARAANASVSIAVGIVASPRKKRKLGDNVTYEDQYSQNQENGINNSNRAAGGARSTGFAPEHKHAAAHHGIQHQPMYSQQEVEELLKRQSVQLEANFNSELDAARRRYESLLSEFCSSSLNLEDARHILEFLKSRALLEESTENTIKQTLEAANQQQRLLSESLVKEQEKCRLIVQALRSVATDYGMALPPPLAALTASSPALVLPPAPVPTTIFPGKDLLEKEIKRLESHIQSLTQEESAQPAPVELHESVTAWSHSFAEPDTDHNLDAMLISESSQEPGSPMDLCPAPTLECDENLGSLFDTQDIILLGNPAGVFSPPPLPHPSSLPAPSNAHQVPQIPPSFMMSPLKAFHQKIPTIIVTPPPSAPTSRRKSDTPATGRARAAAAAIAALPAPQISVETPVSEPPTSSRIRKVTPQQQMGANISVSTVKSDSVSKRGPSRTSIQKVFASAHVPKKTSSEVELFAQNLPDAVTLQQLKEFFQPTGAEICGFFQGAKGTGFIAFPTIIQAQRALSMKNKVLLGHTIQLSLDKK